LKIEELRVEGLILHQFVVRARLDYPRLFEHINPVCGSDRRKTVRYQENGSSRAQASDAVKKLVFRTGIQGSRRFVQDDERRIPEEGSREGHSLPLSAQKCIRACLNRGPTNPGSIIKSLMSADADVFSGREQVRDPASHRIVLAFEDVTPSAGAPRIDDAWILGV
jgi:hypothetical protein